MEGGALIKKYNSSDTLNLNEQNDEMGAKLLASGSSSCIFKPFIPCKNTSDKQTNDKISKIVYGKKSDKYLGQEKTMNNIIRKIKGYKSWCLIYDTFCKAPTYSNIFKNYDKNIIDCLDEIYTEKFNKTNNMLIGDYGGITFEDYFENNILNKKSVKTINKEIYILFKKMAPLFLGLDELYKNKLLHLDIKVNNIVLHNNVFKYIDFGLSCKLSNNKHLKTRSDSEFNGKRYYLWYPIEYIYSNANNSDLDYELSKLNSGKTRKHFEKGLKIHKLLNNDFESNIRNNINDRKMNKNELYSKIDVYSLGLLIPYLFVDYGITKYINKSNFLKELFSFFSEMCNPEYDKRITPIMCLKIYYTLLKKYSDLNNNNSNKKLSKKISIKKSKKKKSKKKKLSKNYRR
uniref:Protein kinase domain-containing protein n=1 Tax=viral metagenome TaxID=1070528 RepID=A0A6C0C7G8_9ZZZZ